MLAERNTEGWTLSRRKVEKKKGHAKEKEKQEKED